MTMGITFAIFITLCICLGSHSSPIHRQFINDPDPGAPFSQAVVLNGRWVYISGQQGLDPRTGELVTGGAEAETMQALKNIEALLYKVGGNRYEIVKLTNYVTNMADLPEINKAYPKFFRNGNYPARATIQIAALPDVGLLEIDAVAILDYNRKFGSRIKQTSRTFLNATRAPVPMGPYSHAVVTDGRIVHTAAQQGIDPQSRKLAEGGVEAEATKALENILSILLAAGGKKNDIAKLTVYLKDMDALPDIYSAYLKFFKNGIFPQIIIVQTSALPGAGLLEIDAMAVIKKYRPAFS